MKISLLLLLIFGSITTTVSAQDTTFINGQPTSRIGGSGSVFLSPMTANIQGFQGIPSCCPDYKTGNGLSFIFGGEYQHALSKNVSIGARGGISIFGGKLLANEFKKTINAGIEQIVSIEHSIAINITDIFYQPFLEYRILTQLPLQVGITAHHSISATFSQTETILTPSTIVFENNRRDRLNANGDIPAFNNPRFDIATGIGYILPLSKEGDWKLVPKLELAIPISNLINSGTLNVTSYGVGISLYRESYQKDMIITPAATPPPPTPVVAIPIPKPEPKLLASIALKMKEDGPKEFNFTLQSKATNTAFPLLPYIFFDESSAKIATRYKIFTPTEAKAFTYLSLNNLPDLERYSHVLNIIGKRLNEFPSTSITLVGCNDNTAAESNNKQLSTDRANAVKEYLTSVWNIQQNRITVEARNLPAQFSNPKTDDGKEENRRVEIIPSNTDLYVPVFLNDTAFTASQPNFFVVPQVIAEAGVKQWTIKLIQAGKILWNAKGNDEKPTTMQIPFNDETAPKYGKDLEISLEVTDNNGKHISATDKLAVNVVQDTSIERKQFTLVLFDFNSSELTPLNRKVVSMIKDQIKPDSRITIIGFADRSGNLEYNKKLALKRGGTLAQTLNRKDADVSAYNGNLLINNDLPEGRYFCRTVRLLLEDKR
jgi:outer membrane protein OmpA-like peptidoglycan-associated protein